MKKLTKILSLVLAVLMCASLFAGCNGKQTVTDDGEKIVINIAAPGLDEKMKDDEIYKLITEKFNIDFEFNAISTQNMAEKGRLWIASGSVPDIMFSDFVYKDYLSWGKQGLVKPLPKDYAKKYPNLADGLERTMILSKLEEDGNGVIFGIPRSMQSIHQYGFETSIPNHDRHGLIYRKDWAKQLGIETDTIMSYEDFINMAVKFKEADFAGVGATNTMGVATTASNAPFIFVHAQNPNWNVFYKNADGKYVSGYNDEATVTGLKAYKEAFDKGVLHPTFYTHKTQDLIGYFATGKAGILFQSCGASDYQTVKTKFAAANPGLNADECVDVMWIEGIDGVVRTRQLANYWSCLYFNPNMDDAKFERILSFLDYLVSDEGNRLINAGFEGKEYKVEEDGSLTSLIEQSEDGSYKKISDIYPSTNMFTSICTKANMGLNIAKNNVEAISNFMKAKVDSNPESKILDLDMEFYNSDTYGKFTATNDIATIMAEIITSASADNVEKAYKDKVASFQNKIDEVANEINETLGK